MRTFTSPCTCEREKAPRPSEQGRETRTAKQRPSNHHYHITSATSQPASVAQAFFTAGQDTRRCRRSLTVVGDLAGAGERGSITPTRQGGMTALLRVAGAVCGAIHREPRCSSILSTAAVGLARVADVGSSRRTHVWAERHASLADCLEADWPASGPSGAPGKGI